jgi:membrane protease YdiL (CAAX protease family)
MNIQKVKFTLRDYLGLLILPGLFLAGHLTKNLFIGENSLAPQVLIILVLYLIALAALVISQAPVLKHDWSTYRQKLQLKVLISVGGMIVMHLILIIAKRLLPAPVITDFSNDLTLPLTPLILIIGSLPPIIAPFLEELTFRHLLFYKFRHAGIFYPLFFVISSFLFGLSHLPNFHGEFLPTVPYMLVGAFLALVYARTKNIWYPLGMHFVFNFINSFPAAIFLALFGGTITP